MSARFAPTEDGWIASEDGFVFKIRRLGGAPQTETLIESNRYLLAVRGLDEPTQYSIRINTLGVPSWCEEGSVMAEIALRHEFGDLQIELVRDQHAVAEVAAEVRPRYLDVEDDFSRIREDLASSSHAIAYSLWKQATHRAFPDFTVQPGVPEWLQMLREVWTRIRRTLLRVERDPHSALEIVYSVRSAVRATGTDHRTVAWLAGNPQAWDVVKPTQSIGHIFAGGKHLVPSSTLNREREVTVDTPPNRALRYWLRRIEKRVKSVLEGLDRVSSLHFAHGQRDAYAQQLHQIHRGIERHTVHGFLREVSDAEVTPAPLHAARADPRYRQLFRDLSLLSWGVTLGVAGRPMRMSLRETWELYEYWVYLYIVKLFTEWGWETVSQNVARVDSADGSIVVDLPRGEAGTVRFRDEPGKRQATLTFHSVFPSRDEHAGLGLGARTSRRDVDILLHLQAGQDVFRAVLDPKYRAELADGCLVAPLSAINDMHVYRDAVGRWVVAPGGGRRFEGILDAAVAVYPSRDELCASHHRFCRSIEDGIGALPLLPPSDSDKSQLLEAFIRNFAQGLLEAPSLAPNADLESEPG